MKGQDKGPTKFYFDVYLIRGNDQIFSRRYLTEGGAKRRCKALEKQYARLGYRTHIKSVAYDPNRGC